MTVLRRVVSLGLLSILAACGDPRAPVPETGNAPPDALAPLAPSAAPAALAPATDSLGFAIRDALRVDDEAYYFDAHADLDGDGRPEVVAMVAGPTLCGSGGCNVLVLRGDDANGYEAFANISVCRPPIRLGPAGPDGWRNLVVGVGGGGYPAGNAELTFNANTYPPNPTVAPARAIAEVDSLEILVPPFASYRDGKPVPRLPVAGQVLGREIRARDVEELRYIVLRDLMARYAQEQRIEVTQAEKDTYVEHQRAGMQRDREEKLARRDALSARLAENELPAEERASLTSERDALGELIASLDELSAAAARDPAGERAARDEIAGAFIWQWKVDQALYREYGGRIGYQQGGPEPLDAHRQFLEGARARGDFAITDKALEAGFWRYYTDDSIHEFFEAGSAEEADVFTRPWWNPTE